MAQVTLRKVVKKYDEVLAVRGIDLDISDKEFIVLVGPSGCGKSTTLRMIAGLEEISGGDIAIGGHVVNDVPPKDRDIAMVFQNYALYPHMNVYENMSFGLKLKKTPKDVIDHKVGHAAGILGLAPYLERYPRQLSGGQRQRVAMGRAIVRDPQVFLFDEPLSNLDAKLRVQMRSEIRELHQRLKTTTVYVTHDQIEAMTMADKIVVMREGRISQVGAPLDLYDRPANLFVAGFIGSPAMNLIEGEIGPGQVFKAETFDLALPTGAGRQGQPSLELGRKVTLGFRPEHLQLAQTGIPAEVVVVEPTGSETHVLARTGKREIVAVFRERHGFKPGDKVMLAPDPAVIHLFDTQSALRIDLPQ